MDGEQVRTASCCVGDFVRPKAYRKTSNKASKLAYGRIVPESSCGPSPLSASRRSRDSGMVAVEFVENSFAESTGAKPIAPSSSGSSPLLEVRRVRATKLVHCSPLNAAGTTEASASDKTPSEMKTEAQDDVDSDALRGPISDRTRTELASLSRLDRSGVEYIIKQCKKSSESLAGLFSAGLPSSVLSAIDTAERQMNSLETREELPEKIALIGKLSKIIAEQLYSPDASRSVDDVDPDSPDRPSSRSNSRGASDSQRIRLSEIIERTRRDSQRGDLNGNSSSHQNDMAQLQERRNMLLTLLSRTSGSRGAGYLNELIEHDSDVFGSDIPSALLASMPSFATGSRNAQEWAGWEDAAILRAVQGDAGSDEPPLTRARARTAAASTSEQASFLDSMLRCRGDSADVNGTLRGGTSQVTFVRTLATCGLLMDNLFWVKALVDSHSKKTQMSSTQKSSSLLRQIVDEEGTPLLLLGISLGCSSDVLSYLIGRGAVVSNAEIMKAASTDQAPALSLLLQHSSFPGDIDYSDFSPDVQTVFAQAKARKEELDRKMREEAGAFVVRLLKRLLDLCFAARRRCSSRVELCSKAVSEILVGNVLLVSLQRAQQSAGGEGENSRDEEDDLERVGRVTVDDASNPNVMGEGLLGALPREVLYEGILSEAEYTTTYLSLVEDHLCSKDMTNGAAGLALLSILLAKFPELRSCSEMQRYGMADLVSFHDLLATDRMAEVVSQQPKTQDSSAGSSSVSGKSDVKNAVVCPNKHTAVIHITRHSSFRCDICGNGVERGRPMHGCRQCDWDACEGCTDKSVSGIVKCSAIKEMAATCHRLLGEEVAASDEDGEGDERFCAVLDILAQNDSTQELRMLSDRLLQRDVTVFKELGERLIKPGGITIHQFTSIVLPTLHAAFVGRGNSDHEGTVLRPGASSSRRSKKARVVDAPEDSSLGSPGDRLHFCREAARLLLTETEEGDGVDTLQNSAARAEPEQMETEREFNDSDGKGTSQTNAAKLGGGGRHFKFSDASQELLRRLQQVLALHERASLTSSVSEDAGSRSARKAGDLPALTTPLEIRLCPSSFSGSSSEGSQDTPLVVLAEPLVPIADLQLHVLRSCNTWDDAYLEFSRK